MKNPWKILASKPIYTNPWISLTEHEVTNPSGNPGIYGVVSFKNAAVGVVPYEDGHIWMVGQYRFPLERYSWEIPEGGGEPSETPLAAAQRELQEETGLVAAQYEPLLEMHLSNSVSDEWGIVYLATGLTQGEASPEDTEDIRLQKMSLEEVYRRVEAREITDSLTVAAIYKMMILKLEGKLK
ncbi:MAG: NUDIX domain-containing protein [Bacteroidia bacterium]